MAATILISVVLMSLGTYLFITFSNYSTGVNEEVRTNQIAQFNSQFLKYQVLKKQLKHLQCYLSF